MFKRLLVLMIIVVSFALVNGQTVIRINQLGYQNKSIKVAVAGTKDEIKITQFEVINNETGKVFYKGRASKSFGKYGPFIHSYRLDFSTVTRPGTYYIKAGDIKSPVFTINNSVYDGSADFLLNYMRQQRCGYNPMLKDSCHTHDGFIIYLPELEGTHIDVRGGWHDASDYLQYVTTSANAVYQMLFAYKKNPSAFEDHFDKNGDKGSNGIPDILDEAKWGLDWLVRMNPKKDLMFNQIADDRDHRGFRIPNLDTTSYGKGLERPVYFCTGEPQGLYANKNRATGIASTAGKYASAFALASDLLKQYYPEFANELVQKSVDAYNTGLNSPGVCQTAPCASPYFYEEDNWVDDMELAAIELNSLLNDKKYLDDAVKFGRQEKTTPWMGADTANHYQWYPFLNLGHYNLATLNNREVNKEFVKYLKEGIEKVYQRGKNNAFLNGIPFIWCSNNLTAAALTQLRLYNEITGDTKYQEMEALLRDWLFGCNPWGTSMIIGFPKNSVNPKDPHSAFTKLYYHMLAGGLVDGPVYASIFNRLKGITLYSPDEFKDFQSDYVVFHDDYGDYSTDEPTMDGTASLTYYLSALQMDVKENKNFTTNLGAIIRGDKNKKEISLVFTGHEFADGGEIILNTLKKHSIKGAFFLTGDFYRNPAYSGLIKKLINDGHYLGAHSDKHILYTDWSKRDSTLISREQFQADVRNNYAEMKKFGIEPKDAKYYLPPYEWYNREISEWTGQEGLNLINFTPGTSSNQDWTIPSMGDKYFSSETIYNKIIDFEKKNSLNGFILLTHIGTHPERTDKFYNKLDDLIKTLLDKGYTFKRVDKI